MLSDKFKTFFLYFVFFVYFAGAPSTLASSNILLFVCVLYAGLCAYRDTRKFDKIVLLPIALFAVINMISILRFGNNINLQAYVGYNLRFLFAYFLMKFVSDNFMKFYSKAIYLAALISIPFYLIQCINVDFFYSNFSFLNLAIQENIVSRHNWNCLVYTSFPLLDGLVRNSGFAAEPSYFGFYLALGIIIELIRNKYRFNKRASIELVVGLTTFSTTFYMVLILIGLWLAMKVSFKNKIGFAFATTVCIVVFLISSFGMTKIQGIVEIVSERSELGYDIYKDQINLSRMDNIAITATNLMRFPLGHGMNHAGLFKNSHNVTMSASSALFNYITQWGVAFLFLFPWIIGRFWKVLQPNTNILNLIILTVIFMMWMFSSIDFKDPLFFIVVIIGLLRYVPLKIRSHYNQKPIHNIDSQNIHSLTNSN